MTSVHATCLRSTADRPGRPVSPPEFWPSWTAPYENLLETTQSYAGYTTKWSSEATVRRSLSTPREAGAPPAAVLAQFPVSDVSSLSVSQSGDGIPDWITWKKEQAASLCVAYSHYVAVSTPEGDQIQCPLPDAAFSDCIISALFAPLHGLIVEKTWSEYCGGSKVRPKRAYYYLRRPLDEMTPVVLPCDDHEIVYTSSDVPLLVARNQKSISVWYVQESEEGIPEPSVERLESCDPISAFINNTVPEQADEAAIVPRRKIISLRKLYAAPAERLDSLSVFLAHDLKGQLVLCLCVSNVLTGLELGMMGDEIHDMPVSFRIRDAASAVPVLGIRREQRALDIVVRHISGSMSLFIGSDRLCAVELQTPAKLPGIVEPATQRDDFVLADSVGSQFSLLNIKGDGFRFSLRTLSYTSPLVNACLDSISCRFHEQNITAQMIPIYQAMLKLRSQLDFRKSESEERDRDWAIFEDVFLRSNFIGTASHFHIRTDGMDTIHSETSIEVGDAEGTDDNWLFLLKSEHHMLRGRSKILGRLSSTTSRIPSTKQMDRVEHVNIESLRHVIFALHLLYENQKLDSLAHDSRIRLACLNVRLATIVGSSCYIDHYKRDNSHLDEFQILQLPESATEVGGASVPSIFDWIADCVGENCGQMSEFPTLSDITSEEPLLSALYASWRVRSPTKLSSQVVQYYQYLYGRNEDCIDALSREELLLLAMVRDNFRRVDIDSLPWGVALPLRNVLWACRQNPNSSWPFKAFALIGREDLFKSNELDLGHSSVTQRERSLVSESRAFLQIQSAAATIAQEKESWLLEEAVSAESWNQADGKKVDVTAKELDGCEIGSVTCRLRFSEDRRLEEVRALLRSTDPIVMTPINVKDADSSPEFDMVSEQKRRLSQFVQKRFASPVGRGAFTLRTFVPSDPTKSLPVPRICTSGRIFAQRGTKVSFTPTDPLQVQWGEFHNGVASGLRIVASDADREGSTSQILTRSWIVNHRPSDMSGSPSHAGMLFALGLGGYLPSLRTTDFYEYLVPRHDLTSIGLMLGLATGNMGSMHDKITKMLCVHIRYFNSPGFAVPDFQVSVNVQTSAILGLGFLYRGSCEHAIVEGLFAELGHRPGPGDAVDDREGLALAAGLSIGLVCLGEGSAAFDAADSRLIDRLVIYAKGGTSEVGLSSTGRPGSGFKTEIGARPETSHQALADSEASRVKEGNFINTDVVSPGALLALALIYMKTGNRQIVDRIPMPETLYNLDRAKPDHVFLRILTRSLILWSEIQPTKKWILESLPTLIRPVQKPGASACFDLLGRVMVGGSYQEHDTDVADILRARAFATAGVCTAIALRYAGTNDSEAVAVLCEMTEAFEGALLAQEKDDESMEWVYMVCLCSLALAVSIVASGTGDLKVLKLLRRIRKRRASSLLHKRYGSHLAVHMAIGFLFLGGGCQTFGTHNVAIAGLLCAIYPQFPTEIGDNQYHLQALRHLYVLAAEPRCIETRDVDTGTPCCVDVEVRLKNGTCRRTRAPCIVPEASQVQEVAVVSERYWPTTVPINPAARGKGWYSHTSGQVLFVKRRTGHLPYGLDPKGSKGLLARSPGPSPNGADSTAGEVTDVEHLVRAFSADPDILAFVRYFCSPAREALYINQGTGKREHKDRPHIQILYECLARDKPEAVRSYLDAERAALAVAEGRACPATVGSLAIAQSYIQANPKGRTPFLSPAFLSRIISRAHECVNNRKTQSGLLEYVRSCGRKWPETRSNSEVKRNLSSDLGVSIRLHRIPPLPNLVPLATAVRRATTACNHGLDSWLVFSGIDPRDAPDSSVEALLSALDRCV